MRRAFLFAITITLIFICNGCVVKDLGQTVEQTVKGDYFLNSNQPDRGRESFSREVQENPNSALANYYYGRFLLQEEEYELALKHLKKAGELDKLNAEYQFWSGVAFGANGLIDKEEKSYQNALDIDKNHLQSLIYLGHTQLNKKKYTKALDLYSRALDIWPSSPSVLYNRALILNRLNRAPEERLAWLFYLDHHPSGAMAQQATEYLNLAGDYSYRNHKLGDNIVTVEKIRFDPFTHHLAEPSYPSLSLLGDVFSTMEKGILQVVVYQRNNKELAQKKALSIKKFLLAKNPELTQKSIGISWFSEPHKLTLRGKKLIIDESVSFFVTAK